MKNYSIGCIDGSVQNEKRISSIKQDSKISNWFVLHFWTHARRYSFKLAVVNTAILHDYDWNLQNNFRAQTRCYWMKQKSVLTVYQISTKCTSKTQIYRTGSCMHKLYHTIFDMLTKEEMKTER
jgi:ABC-type cobalamin/Fe3+-siderophores transport system ATPase subunit